MGKQQTRGVWETQPGSQTSWPEWWYYYGACLDPVRNNVIFSEPGELRKVSLVCAQACVSIHMCVGVCPGVYVSMCTHIYMLRTCSVPVWGPGWIQWEHGTTGKRKLPYLGAPRARLGEHVVLPTWLSLHH